MQPYQPKISDFVPSLWQCFRSFFYTNTYLNAVDLSKSIKESACPDTKIVEVSQKLASQPEVKKILSGDCDYTLDGRQENSTVLKDLGFIVLSSKPLIQDGRLLKNADGTCQTVPFPNVAKHPGLQGWIIKAAGRRIPEGQHIQGPQSLHNEAVMFHPQESLLRLTMNQRIRSVAEKFNLEIEVPTEYAVPYVGEPAENQNDFGRQFFVISQELDILSEHEGINAIRKLTKDKQVALANKICIVIKEAGLADTNLGNIRFLRKNFEEKGELVPAFIDTEPTGLLKTTSDSSKTKPHSVEKCARIGLETLQVLSKRENLDDFSNEVDRHLKLALKERSTKKIVFSVVCPLYPIVLAITSIVIKLKITVAVIFLSVAQQNAQNKSPFITTDIQENLYKRQINYLASIEGIPFSSSPEYIKAFS